MHYTAALLALCLAVRQTAADGSSCVAPGGWGYGSGSSTPNWGSSGTSDCCAPSNPNCAKTCNPWQSTDAGFNSWSHGEAPSVPGMSWSGFTCQSSSYGKRMIGGRGGSGSMCAVAPLSQSPGLSYSNGFSCSGFKVSGDKPMQFIASYSYDNGQSCEAQHSCGTEPTDVSNDQCGGATGVTYKPAPGYEDCTISIHSYTFECATSTSSACTTTTTPVVQTTSTPVVYTQTTPASASSSVYTRSSPVYTYSSPVQTTATSSSQVYTQSSPAATTSSASSPVYSLSSPAASTSSVSTSMHSQSSPVASTSSVSTSVYSQSSPAASTASAQSTPVYTYSSPVATTASSGSTPVYTSSSAAVSTTSVQSTPVYTHSSPAAKTASSSPVTTYGHTSPLSSASPSTQAVVTTVVVDTTTTLCPVTATLTSSGKPYVTTTHSVSTVTYTHVSTVCTKCIAPQSTAKNTYAVSSYAPLSSGAAPSAPAASAVPASCPAQVPQCLNIHAYMIESSCKDNTDTKCYCVNAAYTNQVMACMEAYSPDYATKCAAFSCFAGICASYLGSNPAPVAAVPSTITIAPQTTTGPMTTVTVSTVMTVPCTYSSGPSSGLTVSGSSTVTTYNTVATVPQVGFTTANAGVTSSVGLVAGSPAAAAASTTPAATAGGVVPTAGVTGGAPAAATSPIIAVGAANGLTAPGTALVGALVFALFVL